jgi:Domain of unknown function (DUF3883)
MPSNYDAIKKENLRRHGTDIGEVGPMLLANRYDDRTHFIFELLQNAEDALKRRINEPESRSVSFKLSPEALQVSHFGEPFTEKDVRGICGIGKSTKQETDIGRFGIGFKSVYAFTDAPEIRSGNEHFAIDSFVWPRALATIPGSAAETTFVFPFRSDDIAAVEDIRIGLQRLGARTLLFLREINEIEWSVVGGPAGLYLRGGAERVSKNGRKVLLIGEGEGKKFTEEWLIFSREVRTATGVSRGYVEIAFAIQKEDKDRLGSLKPISDSVLVVFFPTNVETHLGFVIQGPYRTTPSRDSVPPKDEWNQHLVRETAELLISALHSLRELGLLNADALGTLPLDPATFGEESRLRALFERVRESLASEPLLPKHAGAHLAGKQAKLASNQELRALLDPSQLTSLFGGTKQLAWLSGDITQDRTPALRRYLMREHEIDEITPAAVMRALSNDFLEAQSDFWIIRLYEFLSGQPALLRSPQLSDKPIIRLENGSHVPAFRNRQPQAFLPTSSESKFPTVKRSICLHRNARKFLEDLALTEPDPVDDVIRNILPNYSHDEIGPSEESYEGDIERILAAYKKTDSTTQKEKLINTLRDSLIVKAVDTGTGAKCASKPTDVYLASQKMKELFGDVPGVLLVDDSHECLRGEDVRTLLETCGAARYLQPIPAGRRSWNELSEMRVKAGTVNITQEIKFEDWTLRGIDELLVHLPQLETTKAARKSALLWEAFCDFENRRGTSYFVGTYEWFYVRSRDWEFEAAFVKTLNETAWVPDRDGRLQRPGNVAFEELVPPWKRNAFLRTQIKFKPPIIEVLAKAVGIESGVITRLIELGVLTEAKLNALIGLNISEVEKSGGTKHPTPDVTPLVTKLTEEQRSLDSNNLRGGGSETKLDGRTVADDENGSSVSDTHSESPARGNYERNAASKTDGPKDHGQREFVSYVGVQPDEEKSDPDGLGHEERMALEACAIEFILKKEPNLQRTPPNNPGFDLFAEDSNGNRIKWVEVKAMARRLESRSVGMSRAQFDFALTHGSAYWLYVVERAGVNEQMRVVRIQDPAGKARTFTFDRGWLGVAEIDATD